MGLSSKDDQIASDQERLQSLTDQLNVAESEAAGIQQRCTKMAEERAKEILEFKRLQDQLKEVCLKNERLSVAHHTAETDARILREEMEHRKRVQNASKVAVNQDNLGDLQYSDPMDCEEKTIQVLTEIKKCVADATPKSLFATPKESF
ncbi:hypothetical protein ACTXT7_010724 [Hymenolepis weldensis]